jgi:hypothetical protein
LRISRLHRLKGLGSRHQRSIAGSQNSLSSKALMLGPDEHRPRERQHQREMS